MSPPLRCRRTPAARCRSDRTRNNSGNDLEPAVLLELAEGADHVAAISKIGLPQRVKALVVHQRERLIFVVPVRAVNFFFRQLQQGLEVPHVTVLQQRVKQHRAEGGGERQGQPCVHAVAQPAIHDLNERQISFGEGFEEPVFFEKMLVLRVPNERQMRVEDEREIALHGELRDRAAKRLSLIVIGLDRVGQPIAPPIKLRLHQAKSRAGGGANGWPLGFNQATCFTSGGLSFGSWGCAPTSPRYSVLRLNFSPAPRLSVPSAEVATAGRL